ncbi:DUF5602 domain-containing protein [Ottowia sp.]|jgi:hypothetical protein|uniref:DUF5602 domain-containing protein n=2 Tax=Ottowia sp. TaxID=1898956 RepID=UPI002D19B9E1|nr:DUF5602 domain-containing protein [Ottowia sp.]HRN77088.1 hypothetical protein [Ottowia sp.]
MEVTMTRFSVIAVAAATAWMFSANPALGADSSIETAPPAAPYKAVSSLVKLPDFIPGLGQLFVDPATLPAGPFLGYDRQGKLVTTTYMIPLSMMKPNMNLDDLKVPAGAIDHVDIQYNAGHPGVAEPHVHIVLWNVPAVQEARVAK